MSISDTRDAAKYASIAEVAAAQAKTYADKLDSAPDYASQAAASAASAAQSATVAVAAESTVNNYVIAASQYASQAEASAQTAGSAAESAVGRTLRVPESAGISALPASADRQSSVVSFDSSGNAAVKPIADFAILDSNGKIPVENIPAIALTEPFVVSSQAAMLALNAQVGDIAKRTDKGYSFVLAQLPASTLANWVQLNDDILAQLSQSGGAAQIGAVGKASATTNVQALLDQKTYASDLSAVTGSSLVGYQNPSSSVSELVKNSLDKLNVRLIYAADFGVKTDSSDNADALWSLGQFISNATVPLYVIFPKGVSLVGSQQLAGATGQSYSYAPSYFSRPWGDLSDRGWFSVHRTDNDITLDMSGWTLKINSGMKQGSFDPVSGAAYTPASLPFYSADYQAGHGFIMKFYKATKLKVINGKIDGNIPGAVWGGKYGDDGYQVPSYNLWVNECNGIRIDGLLSDSSPVDGFYINNGVDTGAISPLSNYTQSVFSNMVSTNCGRNCWSYTGGHDDVFINPIGYGAGNLAYGIGSHFSAPQAAIDIESEAGAIARLKFYNVRFTFGGLAGVQIYGPNNDINDISFEGGIIHSPTGGLALNNASRNVSFRKTQFIGSVSSPTGSVTKALTLEDCEIYNRVGNDYVTDFGVKGVFQTVINVDIHYEIPNSTVSAVVIDMTGNPGVGYGGSMSQFRGVTLYASGNSANQTVQFGAVQYFRDAEIFVNSDMTGTNPVALYMNNSSPGSFGYATNSAYVNFGGSMAKRPDANIWYDTSVGMLLNNIYPSIDNTMTLGKSGMEFAKIFINQGIQLRSPSSQKWLITVSNSGAVTATAVS